MTGGYARFYDFQVTSRGNVTITLESDHATPRVFLHSKDEWMQIRQGIPHIDREGFPHHVGLYSTANHASRRHPVPGQATPSAPRPTKPGSGASSS